MPGALTSDPTLGTGSVVGRYFGIVSTIPSVLFAGWIYVLLAAGARSPEGPSFDQLAENSRRLIRRLWRPQLPLPWYWR